MGAEATGSSAPALSVKPLFARRARLRAQTHAELSQRRLHFFGADASLARRGSQVLGVLQAFLQYALYDGRDGGLRFAGYDVRLTCRSKLARVSMSDASNFPDKAQRD